MGFFFWGSIALLAATLIYYSVFFMLIYYWHEKKTTLAVMPLIFTFEFFITGFLVVSLVSLLVHIIPYLIRSLPLIV